MAKSRETVDLKGKLSRKIAELTMVVHLLFTRNHEREVEIDAIRTVYDQQIKNIESEVKGKISWLEGQLEDLEKGKVLLEIKNNEIEKYKQQITGLNEKEVELRKTIEQKEHLLQMAEKEIVKLREQLTSKADYGNIHAEELQRIRNELEKCKNEISDLNSKLNTKSQKLKTYKKHIGELQEREKDLDRQLQEALAAKNRINMQLDGLEGDWQGEMDRLNDSIIQMTEAQTQNEDKINKLEMKNKQLSQQNKELEDTKRQLSHQIQQLINEKNKRKESKFVKPKQQTPEVPRSTPAYERDDELERLRREVQRYRLEIKNRESNFNRVFAEKNPVVVGHKQSSTASLSPDGMFPNLTGSRSRSSANGQISPSYLPSLK
ncbi:lamin-L(III) [Nematostella vectensis]|uniref:lamin-L(III) n=1 Tax=Nematostella vectensis TaxID=45351 RepID=UPI001390032A|nr:lamin-L(III) [Nematostella vectensis]